MVLCNGCDLCDQEKNLRQWEGAVRIRELMIESLDGASDTSRSAVKHALVKIVWSLGFS